MRVERDQLGELSIEDNAAYGIQTARAITNFRISGDCLSNHPEIVRALAMIKLTAAQANCVAGVLSASKAEQIIRTAEEIIAGQHHEHFVVDMVQGGAGTSSNMNCNEVIANISLRRMGYEYGQYSHLHPNDDVNRSQSTNDVYPTAIRLGLLNHSIGLLREYDLLVDALEKKAHEFRAIVKVGRTQLQDAVPMTLGEEFSGFSASLSHSFEGVRSSRLNLCEVNIGGTAIGNGVSTPDGYQTTVIRELSKISGYTLTSSKNLFSAAYDQSPLVLFSGALKSIAINLSKVSSDLRLLSSGPRAGIGELNLPALQAGSSIMPGKVNPVIPEVVNQVCFAVMGNDLTVSVAADSGQLQLNAMEPVLLHRMLDSIGLLENGMRALRTLCIEGIEPDRVQCQALFEKSLVLATELAGHIGYERASAIAFKAKQNGHGLLETARSTSDIPEHILSALTGQNPDRVA